MMTLLDIFALLTTICAVFAYVNFRYIKLPTSTGLMLISMFMSLSLVGLQYLGVDLQSFATRTLNSIDFHETLMNGMLSVLLFAGALHVNLDSLRKQRGVVFVLSTIGLLLSTFCIGLGSYIFLRLFDMEISFQYCLLLGALISPTDPIAVLALLKSAKAPESVQAIIGGESLFNDGVGVVIFLFFMGLAAGHESSVSQAMIHLLAEGAGGILYGLIIGYVAYLMMKSIDSYSVEVLITLAVVFGGYSLARFIHTSGPLAMVAAGLLIGNQGRELAMSDVTRIHLDHFWKLLDEILNAFLFVLIGLEILLIHYRFDVLLLSLGIIPIVLFSRFLSLYFPIRVMGRYRSFPPHLIKLMTWGGLRGGISVALALSLPPSSHREFLIAVTYSIVVFSVAVQGSTFSLVLKRLKIQ